MVDIQYSAEGMTIAGELVDWKTIDKARNEIRFMNSVLVKISFTYGRQEFHEEQIWDTVEWYNTKANIAGLSGWFSEFAGKHSQVELHMFDGVNVEEITDLKEIVEFFDLYGHSNNTLDITQGVVEQGVENDDLDSNGVRITTD